MALTQNHITSSRATIAPAVNTAHCSSWDNEGTNKIRFHLSAQHSRTTGRTIDWVYATEAARDLDKTWIDANASVVTV